LALGNDAVNSIAAHHELLRGDPTRRRSSAERWI
jgi:hypothetical protein